LIIAPSFIKNPVPKSKILSGFILFRHYIFFAGITEIKNDIDWLPED